MTKIRQTRNFDEFDFKYSTIVDKDNSGNIQRLTILSGVHISVFYIHDKISDFSRWYLNLNECEKHFYKYANKQSTNS